MENLASDPLLFEHLILSRLDIQSYRNTLIALPNLSLPTSELILSLLDHQIRSISILQKNRHHLALYESGCGKTYMACASIKLLHPKKNVIFIAPKSTHLFIKDTIDKMKIKNKVALFTHQRFNKTLDTTDSFLIIDEVHNLKKIKGIRTINAIESCQTAWKILLMTATPIVNSKNDILPVLRMCDCRFENLNVVLKDITLDENYPSVEKKDVFIKLNKREMKNYQNLSKKVLDDLDDMDEELFDRIGCMSNHFLTFASAMSRAGDSGIGHFSAKIRYIKETIHLFGQQIIFSSWIKAGTTQVAKILEKENISNGTITSKMNKLKRQKLIDDYNQKKIQVLILSKTGSEGINLIGTRRVILLEPSWTAVWESQAASRAVRFRSHSHLLLNERKVVIERLLIDHPDSIDIIMSRRYIKQKASELEKFKNMCKALEDMHL